MEHASEEEMDRQCVGRRDEQEEDEEEEAYGGRKGGRVDL